MLSGGKPPFPTCDFPPAESRFVVISNFLEICRGWDLWVTLIICVAMKPLMTISNGLLVGLLANPVLTTAQITGTLCPDPTRSCQSSYSFAPYQLPFAIKEKLIYGKTYKSQQFYAVILKSVKATGEPDCSFVDESERLDEQTRWPARKVFTSRFSCPEELILYENTSQSFNFLALYAGTTLNEARRVLNEVKTKGRYPQAYIKRIRVVVEYST